MSEDGFKAVIFDLDGVITKTALVHSEAWRSMFNEYLHEREKNYNEPFREFTHEVDYLKYVDGKPRYQGVKSFLQSRNIDLPYGDPSDGPEKETICGIGNRKNVAFNNTLQESGVEVYDTTVQLIHQLLANDKKIGVASSSKNCLPVLEAAGLADQFETRVDGVVSAEMGLKGKPDPDIFSTAAKNLGVEPVHAVVVEDAVSGVQAGKQGNFGLVLGIARENNDRDLLANGADIVVSDIGEIGYEGIEDWFRQGLHQDQWSLSYFDYDKGKEKTRESLLSIGNGFFGTRGAMEETEAGEINYPGTYMSGVYNRLVSRVGDRDVENEDLVNVINWLPVRFRIDDEDWVDINKVEILEIKRVLHLNNGILFRRMLIRDEAGRLTRITSRRFASMYDPHLAAMDYTIAPENYSGRITLRSILEGNHINDGVKRYRDLNQAHLETLDQGSDESIQFLKVKTIQSGIEIAFASMLCVYSDGERVNVKFKPDHAPGRASMDVALDVPSGHAITLCKAVALYSSLEPNTGNQIELAVNKLKKYDSFNELLKDSEKQWEKIWDRIDVRIEGDRLAQKLVRLHLYHLMVTTSSHNATIDFGIPARGLHGEAYRGHIFWDELFILPLYVLQFKETAKAVLMYRYRRLDEARKYARENGYSGAMYPWQSGSSGREETQVIHLNPVSGEWGPDYSSLQRHVSLAIAYNIWQYYHITRDQEFMDEYGAEMYMEICSFWISKCKQDPDTKRYSISNVMGPDEFHEKIPGTKEGGLKDNAYTNIMVAWMLDKVDRILSDMEEKVRTGLFGKLGINEEILDTWKDIAGNLRLVISEEGIIAQFDGYFDLDEIDWEAYRQKYGNIYRMDRIMKAEGKSVDNYKVAKQADTLMTLYNLSKSELDGIMERLGYEVPADYVRRNLRYYLDRTSHGSTLSRVVHARLANMIGDEELGWDLYLDALTSDYQDIQGGTTSEGIHAGVMAGTVWIVFTTYAGLRLDGEMPAFEPQLPGHWKSVEFGFSFRDDEFECVISPDRLKIRIESDEERVEIKMNDMIISVQTNSWNEFQIITNNQS